MQTSWPSSLSYTGDGYWSLGFNGFVETLRWGHGIVSDTNITG